MEGDGLNKKTYNHIAFKISKKSCNFYLCKVKELGLEIEGGRKRMPEEGQSIYFYDYDNHLFELHTGTLKARLKKYNNID